MSDEADKLSAALDAAATKELLLSETPRSRFKVVAAVDSLAEAVGALLMLGITAILFVGTLSRYLFNNPLTWVSEIAPQSIVWVSVVGMYISLRRQDLLIVQVLTRRLSLVNRMRWTIATDLISTVVMCILAWFGYRYLQQFGSDLTPLLRIPKGIFMTAIPFGIAAIAIAFLADAWRVWKAGPEGQIDQFLDSGVQEVHPT